MNLINLEFLKNRRCELGITMQEMATHMGFKNASTYLKYETGEYKIKANHLPVLTTVLKCNIDELFFVKKISKTAI
ncbi:transcriptional regulator [Halalkalibacter wakoensis JCM 9140]|uniref:Transcriptional regulator n=1 Tax=Halalkalibacter wakoensis JCM 9140 TaxID=1236970 RepID=W4Q6K7_9BACI|nr:helix-turn-helix transcriptional regulator [Halalkalibacter wakoensis]GAE26994.1 transcriptional regulator [Halalkalibacter wakoensis JCM 9140]